MLLKGYTAVVTGANSGIGEAAAHKLAREGANLLIAGRREDKNQQVADAINASYCVDALPVKSDVSREVDCVRLLQQAKERFGRLDILINNAGTIDKKAVADLETEAFDAVLKTNLYGAFWCAREASRLMRENELAENGLRGYIINISSIVGKEAWEETTPYSTSKFGMMALNGALAEEGKAHRIKSTAICPAMVATPMPGVSGPEYIQPEDIAETILYLLRLSHASWPTEIVIPRRGSES